MCATGEKGGDLTSPRSQTSGLSPGERGGVYVEIDIGANGLRVRRRAVYRLGEEPRDDLLARTTAAERIEMVWELSRRMWELTGKAIPEYDRAHMPVRIVPLA